MPVIDQEKYFDASNFLKAKDFGKGEVTVTVEKFDEIKTRVNKDKPRPILRLKGYESPFGLNQTNLSRMIEKFGNNTDKWAGKKIVLYKVKTTDPSQGGKEVDGLRIK